jgi:2-keto-3-deoxy-6-phosphogluconate aldolase
LIIQAAIDGGFKNVEFTLTTPGCLGMADSLSVRFFQQNLHDFISMYFVSRSVSQCTSYHDADCVADFRKKYEGKVLVGCGTVMDVEDAQRALEAGAEFIVCPILIPEVRPTSSTHGKRHASSTENYEETDEHCPTLTRTQ